MNATFAAKFAAKAAVAAATANITAAEADKNMLMFMNAYAAGAKWCKVGWVNEKGDMVCAHT